MTRTSISSVVSTLAVLACTPAAATTLIGDTVRFQHFFPQDGEVLSFRDFTVEVLDGSAEVFGIGIIGTVNFEADSLILSGSGNASVGSDPDPCNCFFFSDLDPSEGRIIGLEVSATWDYQGFGFEEGDFSYGDDWVKVDLSGTAWPPPVQPDDHRPRFRLPGQRGR